MAHAYNSAVLHADPADGKEGTTTTRVEDFVKRSVLARTLNPGKLPKKLHVDFPHDTVGWPMLGFIFIIDAFRPENGATCFLPRSHATTLAPHTFDGVVPACGPADSMLIYSGSVS